MNLADLARTILVVNHRPISKVRFARVIYFVHKDLIRKKLLSAEAISYIRSPLGPIPLGLHELTDRPSGIMIQHNESSHLSYTNDEFALTEAAIEAESAMLEQYRDMLATIEQTLRHLRAYTTPMLVQLSHREPSWQTHSNGELYHISAADLKVNLPGTILPIKIKIRFTPASPNRSGAMQANLLRGMLEDIVKESTDLEYPDSKSSSRLDKKSAAKHQTPPQAGKPSDTASPQTGKHSSPLPSNRGES